MTVRASMVAQVVYQRPLHDDVRYPLVPGGRSSPWRSDDCPDRKVYLDLTYACPLRCMHCYSESGRRAARMLSRDDALRIADIIISARPERISLSGGEPLLVPWWSEAARLLGDAEIAVTVFTSGWLMDKKMANDLATSVTSVALSIDGSDEQTHNQVRGGAGRSSGQLARSRCWSE